MHQPLQKRLGLLKFDRALGLILGFAIVCKEDGEPYFDTQGDYIPEGSMMRAATEFMQNSRVGGLMHKRGDGVRKVTPRGQVVFCFPMTDEIAKSFGLIGEGDVLPTSGLMIAYKPGVGDESLIADVESGDYGGFSIGGRRIRDKVLA